MTEPEPLRPDVPRPAPVRPEPARTPEEPGPVADAEDEPSSTDEEDAEKEWWDDPRMPWRGKPGRSDLLCWAGFALTGVYNLVLLPLRPVLLTANPYLLAALGGSRVSAVTIGALAATGVGWWPLGLLLGTIGIAKFDVLFWWAGRLWGRGLLEMVSGRSARSARNAARAERVAQRYGSLAIVAGYIIPLPNAVVYATVGAAGMRLRRFLLVDLLTAAATRGLFIYLGYRIGEPAVRVLAEVARYTWYLSIVLLVGVVVTAVRQSRRRSTTAS